MSVTVAIVCLAIGSYGLRAAGLYLPQNGLLSRLAAPVTAAILASLIVGSTAATSTSLTLDSRLIGLVAALLAIAAKKKLVTVLVISVATTAIARLVL